MAFEHPLQVAVIREDIRRIVANRFPDSVYFRAEKQRIVVLAVFHGSRAPAIWHPEPNPAFNQVSILLGEDSRPKAGRLVNFTLDLLEN